MEAFTRDIDTTLQTYAQQQQVPLSSVDFLLTGIATYIKRYQEPNYTLLEKREYADLSIEKLINDGASLRQRYKITCILKEAPNINLHYHIDADTLYIHPVLQIFPSSQLAIHDEAQLYSALLNEINKIKARHHIIIGIHDTLMKKALKAFVTHILQHAFETPFSLALFDGVAPTIAKAARKTVHFNKKLPYSTVEVGTTLITLHKAVYAKNGFNAKGTLIHSNALLSYQSHVEHNSAHISVNDNGNALIYRAKKNGLLTFEHGYLDVIDELTLHTISRNTPSVHASEQSSVSVTITDHDATHDSIGEGVTLQSESIHVTGFVGARSLLEARSVTVLGATHQSSRINAQTATLFRHRGHLRAHSATIEQIEGGSVDATHCNVHTMLGGRIHGSNIHIEQLMSRNHINTSQALHIKTCLGEENCITVNYKENPLITYHLSVLEEELEALKDKRRRLQPSQNNKLAELDESIATHLQHIASYEQSALSTTITIDTLRHDIELIVHTPDNQTIKQRLKPNMSAPKEPLSLSLQESATHYTLLPFEHTIKKKSVSLHT